MINRLISTYIRSGPSKGKERVVRQLLRFAPGRPVRTRYGVTMVVDPLDTTNWFSILGVAAYDFVFNIVDQIKPGMVFIDIGANAGIFSMHSAKKVGRDGAVIAFEPSLAVFQKLVRNAALNGLSNFYPFNLALGEQTTMMGFASSEEHTGRGHLSDAGSTRVLQASYPDIASQVEAIIGGRDVLIKIDVEGAEVSVLRTLAPLLADQRVKGVIVEVSEAQLAEFGQPPDALYACIEPMGLQPTVPSAPSAHYDEIFRRS